MRVYKVDIPDCSALLKGQRNYDYVDSYQSSYRDPYNKVSSKDIGKAFFSAAPNWTRRLFAFRNKLVRVFGLKTSQPPHNSDEFFNNFSWQPGERIGIFQVFKKTENEVIMGENDKHLNFRVSLLKEQYNGNSQLLTISTVVEFNNWFGRLYFLPVKPLHKIIVPAMLKSILKHLEND